MRKTIEWKDGQVFMIDQTKLPHHFEVLCCKDYHEVADAIKKMVIRGAPAIGVAAAYGMALAAKNIKTDNWLQFINEFAKAKEELSFTRPTAVNLSWALNQIWALTKGQTKSISKLRKEVVKKAQQMAEDDVWINHRIGENGIELFEDNDCILTHCNAGSLATVFYGTALGVIRSVYKKKKNIQVFADETRPVLQGARLTVWELQNEKIPVTLICDSVAGFLMFQGKVNKVIVGADRIASNGDVANKIGTYTLSVLAKNHRIPFLVAAPISTIDLLINTGSDIPIEERSGHEVTTVMGHAIAPTGTRVYNPAFDVTPHQNIDAIITEAGLIRHPYSNNIKKLLNETKNKKDWGERFGKSE